MLLQFRKTTRGFVATIIFGLVGLATVIFLIPQSGITQLGGATAIAEVSGRKITPVQLRREMELTLRAQRNQGQNISQEEAIAAGLHERLLQSMITRNAVYAYAEKVGISASDTQVADFIRRIPGVLNPVTGSFDEAAYAQFLNTMRYTRPEFEDDVRGDLSSQLLMSSLVSGVRAPSSFGAVAFVYETETRVVSIAEAPASAAGATPPPTEAQLQQFWEENQERLRIPEFRALTLVYARASDFVPRVNVPEERIREEFEQRRATLTQPERRTYVRISAQNQQQANEAAARISRGETPEAVATAMNLQVTRGTNQPRTEVTDPRVAEAVFSQQRGAARAVQAQLSPWAVIRVDAITPAVEPNYAAQREELRNSIATDEAADLLNTAIGSFEEARAGGTPIVEAARASGLTVVSIPATSAEGHDPADQPIAALEGQQDLLETAFQTPENEASDFAPAGDADVLIAVDRITPASVRPLAEVRDQLREAWIGRERGNRMRELGAQFVTAVQGGQTFAQAARARGFAVRVTSQPLNRQAAGQIPSRGLAAQIFNGAQGAVVTDLRVDGEAILVAQVEQINRQDPAAAPQVIEQARAQFEEGLTSSLGEAAQNEIVARAHARRNERLLQQTFPTGDTAATPGEAPPSQ